MFILFFFYLKMIFCSQNMCILYLKYYFFYVNFDLLPKKM